MKALAVRALGAALVVVALFAAVGYVKGLRDALVAAREQVTTATQGNKDRDAVIKTLEDTARENELARAKLEGERNGIRASLAEREQTFRRMIDENKNVREWAFAAVPGPVIRLRNHGALTGAQAYREAIAGGDALHPSGGDDSK